MIAQFFGVCFLVLEYVFLEAAHLGLQLLAGCAGFFDVVNEKYL